MGDVVTDWDENLRAVIKVLMKWRGVSYEDLAKALGIARSTVFKRFASEGTEPAAPFLARDVPAMADLFNVPVAVLYRPIEELIHD